MKIYVILARCSFVLDNDGKVKPFSKADRESTIKNVIEPMARDGLRTISLAYKDYVIGMYSTVGVK